MGLQCPSLGVGFIGFFERPCRNSLGDFHHHVRTSPQVECPKDARAPW